MSKFGLRIVYEYGINTHEIAKIQLTILTRKCYTFCLYYDCLKAGLIASFPKTRKLPYYAP